MTTSFQPSHAKADFLPTNIVWPEDPNEFKYVIQQLYRKIANTTNCRDVANYEEQETVTGQRFFSPNDNQAKRETFRKTVDISSPLVVGVNLISHGITDPSVNSNFVFTRIYGVIQGGAPTFVPIPNDNIHLETTITDVSITIPAAYAGFTGVVILEYIKG